MLKNILLLMLLLGTSLSSRADDWSYSFGLSPVFVNMIDRVSSNEERKVDAMGTLHPYFLQAGLSFEINNKSSLDPFLAE